MRSAVGFLRSYVPSWLLAGEGLALVTAIAKSVDEERERLAASRDLRFPSRALGTEDETTALAYHGRARGLPRGRIEAGAAYASRLLQWLTTHAKRGTAGELARQVSLYWGGLRAWAIDRNGNRTTAEGTSTEYEHGLTWDWDGGVAERWSRFWLGVEGGTTITAHPDWGDPALFGGLDEVEGQYAIGQLGASASDAAAMRALLYRDGDSRPFRPGGTQPEWLLIQVGDAGDVARSWAATFSATFGSSGGSTPDGTWGPWYRVDGGVVVPSRSAAFRFWSLDVEHNSTPAGDPAQFHTLWRGLDGLTRTSDPTVFHPEELVLPCGSTTTADPSDFRSTIELVDDSSPFHFGGTDRERLLAELGPSCECYFDAAYDVTAVAGRVSSWLDQSVDPGTGNRRLIEATQGTAAARPHLGDDADVGAAVYSTRDGGECLSLPATVAALLTGADPTFVVAALVADESTIDESFSPLVLGASATSGVEVPLVNAGTAAYSKRALDGTVWSQPSYGTKIGNSYHATATAIGSRTIYALGNLSGTGYCDRTYYSDNGGGHWTRGGDGGWGNNIQPTLTRVSASRVILVGGSANAKAYASDNAGASWQLINAAPGWAAAAGFSCVRFAGGLVVFGGGVAATWRSEDGGATWTRTATNNGLGAYQGMGSAVIGGTIYAVAGNSGGSFRASVYASVDGGVTFSLVTSSPGFSGRNNPAMWAADGRLWIAGGYAAAAGYITDSWFWDPRSGSTSWVLTAAAAFSGRQGWAYASIGNREAVIDGNNNNTVMLTEASATYTRAANRVSSAVLTVSGSSRTLEINGVRLGTQTASATLDIGSSTVGRLLCGEAPGKIAALAILKPYGGETLAHVRARARSFLNLRQNLR